MVNLDFGSRGLAVVYCGTLRRVYYVLDNFLVVYTSLSKRNRSLT